MSIFNRVSPRETLDIQQGNSTQNIYKKFRYREKYKVLNIIIATEGNLLTLPSNNFISFIFSTLTGEHFDERYFATGEQVQQQILLKLNFSLGGALASGAR
uniref:Uncharacterized protein n=1 Tax=Caulerpa verticillata TaxID=177082 RepID=A0A386B0G9_9CHLO|nr:hypothetical protein [Caulerpa verticillata]AYC65153.1 hypothetical protein [Caulerpa verticillata]